MSPINPKPNQPTNHPAMNQPSARMLPNQLEAQLDSSPHSLHLRSQESRRITSIRTISQMSSSDNQSSRTDHITHSAIDLSLILRVIRDPTTILQITGESEENNSLNLIFDARVEFLDCVVDDCAALTVKISVMRCVADGRYWTGQDICGCEWVG